MLFRRLISEWVLDAITHKELSDIRARPYIRVRGSGPLDINTERRENLVHLFSISVLKLRYDAEEARKIDSIVVSGEAQQVCGEMGVQFPCVLPQLPEDRRQPSRALPHPG